MVEMSSNTDHLSLFRRTAPIHWKNLHFGSLFIFACCQLFGSLGYNQFIQSVVEGEYLSAWFYLASYIFFIIHVVCEFAYIVAKSESLTQKYFYTYYANIIGSLIAIIGTIYSAPIANSLIYVKIIPIGCIIIFLAQAYKYSLQKEDDEACIANLIELLTGISFLVLGISTILMFYISYVSIPWMNFFLYFFILAGIIDLIACSIQYRIYYKGVGTKSDESNYQRLD
jgi:hypothetical protein